jgi:hypothetical protein
MPLTNPKEDALPSSSTRVQSLLPEACESIDELLSLFDQPFVEAAYQTLLLRKGDPVGLRYYTERLRIGHSRISVLDQLIRSNEVRDDWNVVDGLAHQIRGFRRSLKWSGWRKALFDPELGRTPAIRRTRAIQNSVGAQRQILRDQIEDLANRQRILEIGLLALAKDAGGAPTSSFSDSVSTYDLRPRSLDEMRGQDLPAPARLALERFRF